MKFGKANEIPQVKIQCECDRFENMIREMGVEFCCEWFGHKVDSDFTKETIRVLLERSNHTESNASVSISGDEPEYAPRTCSARLIEVLTKVQRFLDTCEAGDYSTSFVCHPSFDEEMYKDVRSQVDSIIQQNAPHQTRRDSGVALNAVVGHSESGAE